MVLSQGDWVRCVIIYFCATRVYQLNILQRMLCTCLRAFSTRIFCSLWKSICPWMLHPKCLIFHHLLNFTSSLNVYLHLAWCLSLRNALYYDDVTDDCAIRWIYDDPLCLTKDCKTENKNLIKWLVRINRNSFPNQLEHYETIVGRGKYQRSK